MNKSPESGSLCSIGDIPNVTRRETERIGPTDTGWKPDQRWTPDGNWPALVVMHDEILKRLGVSLYTWSVWGIARRLREFLHQYNGTAKPTVDLLTANSTMRAVLTYTRIEDETFRIHSACFRGFKPFDGQPDCLPLDLYGTGQDIVLFDARARLCLMYAAWSALDDLYPGTLPTAGKKEP